MINDKVHIITDKTTNTETYHVTPKKDEQTDTLISLYLFTGLGRVLQESDSVFFWLGNIQDDGRAYRLREKGSNEGSVKRLLCKKKKRTIFMATPVTEFFNKDDLLIKTQSTLINVGPYTNCYLISRLILHAYIPPTTTKQVT